MSVSLHALAALAALALAGGGHDVTLVRRTTEPALVEPEDGAQHFVEPGIAPRDAEAIRELRADRNPLSVPIIVKVPDRPDRFLVSDWTGPGGGHGRRLFLLARDGDGFRQLDRSRAAGESQALDPVVFSGGGRAIVLARIGTEFSWGLSVYEIAGDHIRELGDIPAAVPGPENPTSVLPFARVALHGKELRVELHCDVLLLDREEWETVRREHGRPIVFRHEEDRGFARVP